MKQNFKLTLIKYIFLLLIILLGYSNANANTICLDFFNLKGMSNYAPDPTYIKDGFSGQNFKFIINSENGEVDSKYINNHDLKYSTINSNTIIGLYNSDGDTNIETWTIDFKNMRVYLNRTRVFPSENITGSGSFVGNVKKCN